MNDNQNPRQPRVKRPYKKPLLANIPGLVSDADLVMLNGAESWPWLPGADVQLVAAHRDKNIIEGLAAITPTPTAVDLHPLGYWRLWNLLPGGAR